MAEWSNEVTLEFLRLYKQETAIWNPRDALHKNRSAVQDAWKRIENSLSIECPVVELKKKKESLMATFRPLVSKVKASMKPGSDEIYKPSWFAYEYMAKFLLRVYQPRTSANSQEFEDLTKIYEAERSDEEDSLAEDLRNYEDTEIRTKTIKPINTFTPPIDMRSTKRKGNVLEPSQTVQNRIENQENAYKTVKNQPENRPENRENSSRDECSLYTELLATKLRQFDENTRDILMHEIDTLVFRAKMQKKDTQTFPSPSYTNHTNAHAVNTYNLPPFSPPDSYYSQPSPENFSISQPKRKKTSRPENNQSSSKTMSNTESEVNGDLTSDQSFLNENFGELLDKYKSGTSEIKQESLEQDFVNFPAMKEVIYVKNEC